MARTSVTNRYVPKLGSIVRLAVEGETVETVVVASGTKPAGLSFTAWKEVGCIETCQIETLTEDGEPAYCFNAVTGRYDQKHTPKTDADTRLRLQITCQEVTDFLWQLAFAASSVNSTTGAFVPGSRKGGTVKGWLKIQSQVGTEVVSVLDMWVEMRLSAPAVAANRTQGWKPQIEITQLGNALDAGVLGTPE